MHLSFAGNETLQVLAHSGNDGGRVGGSELFNVSKRMSGPYAVMALHIYGLYIAMAYVVMTYIVMAYTVMVYIGRTLRSARTCSSRRRGKSCG